jgi:AP-2 complex subunit alpha
MAPQMKGLTQFIIDLRNSKDFNEENKRINLEINNIQTKFNTNLNAYQKKKYICKLVYIYLLGYNDSINFGLKQSFQLLEASTYSEKQLGYLAVSILIDYDKRKYQNIKQFLNDLLEIMYDQLVKDLQSNNEDINCLAIQFIASKFNVSDDKHYVEEDDELSSKWLQLIDIIYSFCISPMKNSLIRRKSSIALFTLSKLYPNVILTNSNWIPRILQLIDDKDLSVIMSSSLLIQLVTELKPQYVKSIIPSISSKLHELVIDSKCDEEYFYYKSPAPWLIIKLLSLIETFFLLTNHEGNPQFTISDLDEKTLENLRGVVAQSIQNACQPIKGLPNRNSQSAILFQSVSLSIFLDASIEAINGAINALFTLLVSGETNTRYLALDALTKLTARLNSNYLSSSSQLDENLARIFHLLHDKDISVKRKSLDLLYTISNPQNYSLILNKLLEFFPSADFTLKSELAVKIAILAERFATDSTWYVTTMLKLLSIGGGSNSNGISYISSEVWERIVQIVVNNEDLQEKTCKLIINLLKIPLQVNGLGRPPPSGTDTSENLIKVASFILGEFGHLVKDVSEFSIIVQFQLLYNAYFKVSLITRVMLLNTFLKFLVRFPDEDFVPDILDLFEIESQSIDLEIQTRSHEYLRLATLDPSHLLAKQVIQPLPVFSRTENALMNRIGSVRQIVGRNRSKSLVLATNINTNTKAKSNLKSASHSKSSSSLALPNDRDLVVEEGDLSDGSANPFEEEVLKTTLSPNWYSGYRRMLHYDAGIFYENQLIKITYRVIKESFNITLKFTIINNAAKTVGTDITGFKVLSLESLGGNENPNYIVNLTHLPESTISNKSNMEIAIKVRNVVENNESPILSLSFMCGGSFNQLSLKFPVLLLKTLSTTGVSDTDEFKKRWLQIGEMLGVVQGEYTAKVSTAHRYNSSNIVRLMSRLSFTVVHSTPDTMENGILVMGAGILHTQKSNYGVLTIIKSVDQIGKEFEIVVRCTGGGIPEIIALTLKEVFEGKF